MENIIAKKVSEVIEMPSGHYSHSEGPEEINIRWEYQIPTGYVFSSSEEDGAIPIISEEGEKIGYAVPGFYACYGKVYSDRDKIPDADYQGKQPLPYLEALKSAAIQRQQMQEGCYGD